ncbi:MAG TPA: isochorismatase family protein [Leptospiraceae bacterium]|nr:isochorismatase family protein [Leptospiraceae bacterium]HMW03807.1 isochorismatase family protein [Leptospiraceae bacterium]HMY29787.1 isochorismatase family protein [Leptospiraceae bacterium]HMZ62814.1 isochorismatase family protein [Leptospiraceae bacterium]HNA06937.1 isochorismatase family protein [Leptospiraceae bacterium]
MKPALLITQCLQNDFTKLIGKFDPFPNLLHIGYDEARRMLSEKIEEGPVTTVMDWAYQTPSEKLTIIHIRDWHNPNDPLQKDHLQQFGAHCIQNTEGAEFVFAKSILPNRPHHIVNASGLNDFVDTNLEEILSSYKDEPIRVGIMGVWTEAKVTFLAYDLKTRYPNFEIVVCSALCASSSRTMHFISLEQLTSILGVKVFSSIGDFTNFLTGTLPKIEHKIQDSKGIQIKFSDPNYSVSDTDMQILLYLFRDAKDVEFLCLDGGFSGNVVLKAKAIDKYGHTQVPTVIKIGKRELIGKERTSFERIQEVLGNNAPSIVDYAELEDRGAIKYRYAAMLDNGVLTFQKYYAKIDDMDRIKHKLEIVFKRQLGRLYDASTNEKLNLLSYYEYSNKYAASIRNKVETIIGTKASGNTLNLHGYSFPNVCNFYEIDLATLQENITPYHFVSYLHGDLNGANIIIDAQENVWLIDFFHTHKGHILKDLIKLENDILYIFMKIDSLEEFKEAVHLIDILLSVPDLGEPLNESISNQFTFPQIIKASRTIAYLRSFYPDLIHTDRDPYQLFVGLMRYSMHTLSFDESNDWQKKLALYAGSICSAKIKNTLQSTKDLRIDFIENPSNQNEGKMGLTILPGRNDRARSIAEDLRVIGENNITAVISLITEPEYEEYGVASLKEAYKNAGLTTCYFPIIDQGVPDFITLDKNLKWMHEILSKKQNVLIHCVGGLGRSGTVAACYLIRYYGLSAKDAIAHVRKYRSERAIESIEQEKFIEEFANK